MKSRGLTFMNPCSQTVQKGRSKRKAISSRTFILIFINEKVKRLSNRSRNGFFSATVSSLQTTSDIGETPTQILFCQPGY